MLRQVACMGQQIDDLAQGSNCIKAQSLSFRDIEIHANDSYKRLHIF